jgi:hypothetical protein
MPVSPLSRQAYGSTGTNTTADEVANRCLDKRPYCYPNSFTRNFSGDESRFTYARAGRDSVERSCFYTNAQSNRRPDQ